MGLLLMAINIYGRAIHEEIKLDEEKAQISYAAGILIGIDLKQVGLELDYEYFKEGFIDALENESYLIDPDEAREIVQTAIEKALEIKTEQQRNIEKEFLLKNASLPDIFITESGLQYRIIEEKSGAKPGIDDTVKVHYEGSLIDGTIFDSSYERDEPEEIPLEMVIPGWAEGLMLMNEGSKYQIFVPSSLAYGERGLGQIIPSFSTLVFTIELLEILPNEEFQGSDEYENEE